MQFATAINARTLYTMQNSFRSKFHHLSETLHHQFILSIIITDKDWHYPVITSCDALWVLLRSSSKDVTKQQMAGDSC